MYPGVDNVVVEREHKKQHTFMTSKFNSICVPAVLWTMVGKAVERLHLIGKRLVILCEVLFVDTHSIQISKLAQTIYRKLACRWPIHSALSDLFNYPGNLFFNAYHLKAALFLGMNMSPYCPAPCSVY